MITNYIFYLYGLPKEEQVEQIFILLSFLFITVIVAIFLDYLKSKFFTKHDSS